VTDEEYTAVAWTGISKALWDRLESGGQIPARALDNYMRLLIETNPPDLRRVNSRFGGKTVKAAPELTCDLNWCDLASSDSEEVTIELTKRYEMPR
jgi:hypothetical protein